MKMFYFYILGFWDRLLRFLSPQLLGLLMYYGTGVPLSYGEQHQRPVKNMEGGGGMASQTLPQ